MPSSEKSTGGEVPLSPFRDVMFHLNRSMRGGRPQACDFVGVCVAERVEVQVVVGVLVIVAV